MKINIISLAPDTFVLGTENHVRQFNPDKVLGIPGAKDGFLGICDIIF